MKKLLISTALLGLLAASGGALAQNDRRDRGNTPPPAAPAAAPAAPAAPAAHAPIGGANGHGFTPGGGNSRPNAGADFRPNGGNGGSHRDDHANPGGSNQGNGGFQRDRNNSSNFAPNGNFNGRSNFSAMQRNFNAPHHFHAPSYHRPSGWYSQRWAFGQILPSFFWTPDYWINDFDDFDLPPPPPGTVWVRDGNDALLIDRRSGQIIQVEYGIFY